MSPLRISGSFLLISLLIIASAAAVDFRRSDVNGNGLVEMGDLDIISRHFNESVPISPVISSGDGLKLKLGENGSIERIS